MSNNTHKAAQLYDFQAWYAGYHGYLSLIVCAYGIINNIVNLLVLTRHNMLSSTNTILTGLALNDLLTMCSYVPFALQFYIIHGTQPSPHRNTRSWVHFFLFHINFTVTAHTVSIWLGTLLAVFHYVKLYRFRPRLNSKHTAIYLIMLVYVWSVLILIPNYMSYSIAHLPLITNQTWYWDVVVVDSTTPLLEVITRSNFWIHAVVIKFIPCALMALFGFLLLGTMRHYHHQKEPLLGWSMLARSKRHKHAQITRMYLAGIVLFLLTELPQGVLAVLSGILPGFFDDVYIPLGDMMDIIALIHKAICISLYCGMSKKFRLTFRELFPKRVPFLLHNYYKS